MANAVAPKLYDLNFIIAVASKLTGDTFVKVKINLIQTNQCFSQS